MAETAIDKASLERLFFLFLALVLVKITLAYWILSPHIVLDEHLLFIEAQTILSDRSYFTDGRLFGAQYPPLYPLIISPALLASDTVQAFTTILIINAYISSLIIVPTFFLARFYLSDIKSLYAATLAGISPPSFIYTFTIMAENLFIPLVIASIYCIILVMRENTPRTNLLCGICISLALLTKLSAIVLAVIYIGSKLWDMYQKWNGKTISGSA